MLSCLGFRSSRDNRDDEEHQPLLPQYNDDETSRQARLHEKLHTYQMLRAMSQGYMPSNDQVITHLRTLLSAEVLNPEMPQLSPSGRALIRSTRLWLKQFIDVLLAKNSDDQIQDFLYCLAKARLNVDASALRERASASKAKADATATVTSLKTIGSLLLTNSEFRLFLSDLTTVSRSVFKDTAFALSDVARRAGKELEPSEEDKQALKQGNGGANGKHANGKANGKQPAPSTEDLEQEVADVGKIFSQGAADVAEEAAQSVQEHVQGEEKDALANRLKQAVLNLRKRPDYSDSVNTLSVILRRYLMVYVHAASDTLEAVEEDVDTNPAADEALRNFWSLIRSLGDSEAWDRAKEAFDGLVEASQADPEFEELIERLSKLVQDMLMSPDFYDNAEERFQEVRAKAKEITSNSTVGDKLDDLFNNLNSALQSVTQDTELTKLFRTSDRLAHLLSPSGKYTNNELVSDSINVFAPVLIQAIQYLPIPRVEVATPSIDLLLENLILEPGHTVNHSSFLPYKLHVSTRNDIDVRKARFRTVSSMTSLLTVKVFGLSIAAEDLGYWLRLHSGIFHMMDQGIAGFHLDERGIDIRLDVEIGQDRLERMVTLRSVDVRIHHLNYTLKKSKMSCLAWLFKPLIRPMIARALEYQIASAIADGIHVLNRELLFARERLRATRIAGPEDLWTFIRAVSARLVPEANPDIEARVGVKPGLFRGRYAPGSLVRLWEREAEDAGQKIYEFERGGWRNEIFGVRATPV
ncbi:putative C32A11.02c-like protein [Cladobotryum mycophilum]|uniref:C32A11.02c-like protein n=1 Tax=Cladobotryum mycophilum TaxID=491253 RepID=A0ABR0SQL3_9HYPO